MMRLPLIQVFSVILVCSVCQVGFAGPSMIDRCPVPTIDQIRDVTTTTADIYWSASDSALSVDIEWRELGAVDWMSDVADMSPYLLKDLTPCQTYEVRMVAHCSTMDSEPSPVETFDADACCRIPTGLRLVASSEFNATVAWDSVEFAFAHPVRYRELGATEWTNIEVQTNLAGLQDLMSCTAYEVQVGSKCDLDSTDFSQSLVFQTNSCGACSVLQYCEASADDATTEWIDSVSFGSIKLKSGSNKGYLLRNTVTTTLERKRPYMFYVKPGSVFAGTEFFLRMWIDLNADGVFTDSTELLVDPDEPVSANGWTQSITIPDSIPIGNTRMRIALKAIIGQDTLKPSACGNFLFGEVEDYCIRIDDLCPEVQPVLITATETSATIGWSNVEEAIVFIYRYKKLEDNDYSEPEITEDSLIMLSDLEKCNTYILQTLSVCVQDTSSWKEFLFETSCPNAVHDILPVADHLIAYPNPFTDQITLSLRPVLTGKATVRFFNLVGQELQRRELVLTKDQDMTLVFDRLSHLDHGMYLISIEADARRQVVKLVK